MRLRAFGGLSVDGSVRGSSGAAGQRRPLALLLLLAAAGERGVSRDKLLGLLWPDSDAEHARSALRQTLYALRRDLGLPDLVAGTGELRLNSAQLPSDVGEFDAAIRAGDRERAVALYAGPLADGFFLTKASEFERWLEGERRTRAEQFADAAETVAREAARQGDHSRAVALWRRVASENRLSGRVAVELMRALAEAGDRSGAIEYARVHEALVRAELDAPPDPAVIALAERLRAAPGVAATLAADSPAPGVPPAVEDAASGASPVIAPPEARAEAPLPPIEERPLRRRAGAMGIGSIALAAIGIAILANRRSSDHPLNPALLAVAPYQVLDTSLALWREGLMDVLSHNLDGAGPLRTIAPSVSARHWPGGAHRAAAEEMARRTGAGIVVYGYLFRTGTDSVHAVASLYDARTGRNHTVERREVVARMDRFTDSLTVALLREIDDWFPLGSGRGTPMGRAPSIEALKAFLTGEQFFRRSQWDSARAAYARAVAHDSTFALALRRLGNVIGWQESELDSAAVAYRLRAGALNRRFGPRDSLLILSDSLRAAAAATPTYRAEWPFTRRLLSTLADAARRYPEDPEMWYVLGEARQHYGFGPVLGAPEEEVLNAFNRAIALDSAYAPAYEHTPELALAVGGPALARRYIDAYLRRYPADTLRSLAGLLRYLLAPGAAESPVVRRVLDTVSLDLLFLARNATHRWPDSAQTALRLARMVATPPRTTSDVRLSTRRGRLRRLAQQLAFRGHLREAHRVVADADTVLAFQVALTGMLDDSVDARIARQFATGSGHFNLAMYWWGTTGDTTALRTLLATEGKRARAGGPSVEPAVIAYDTAAALAYLALARGDSAEALRRFAALPDTICITCYPDRLTRARLEAAVGRYSEALRDLKERLLGWESPFDVLFALERGRVAERLGETALARQSYGFVVDAWQFGDPEVQPYVAEARRALARLGGRRS